MNSKECSICGETKSLTEFYKRDEGYRNDCKECNKLRNKKYRDTQSVDSDFYKIKWQREKIKMELHPERVEKRKLYHKNRKENIKNYIKKYKETHICISCGESHISTLDFHHKDSTSKENTINVLYKNGCSMDKIKKEINKCVILCSNCHRKLHYDEKMR